MAEGAVVEGPNMVVLEAENVVELLRSEIERVGGPSAFAKKSCVDRATIHRTLKRQERPGRAIISALDLRVVYSPNGLHKAPRTKKRSDITIVRPVTGSKGGRNKALLLIKGRSVKVPQSQIALLACLHNELGRVVPYNRLCLAIGHQSTHATQLHILRQHINVVRRIVAAHRLPYVLAVSQKIGYALCEVA
jgi:hypothetical protein